MKMNLSLILPAISERDLIGSLAHDLAGPVVAIRSYIRAATDGYLELEDEERRRSFYSCLWREADRLALALDMLTLSCRPNDWAFNPELLPISASEVYSGLNQLLDSTYTQVKVYWDDKNASQTLCTNLRELKRVVSAIVYCLASLRGGDIVISVRSDRVWMATENRLGIVSDDNILSHYFNSFGIAVLSGAHSLASTLALPVDFVVDDEQCGFLVSFPCETLSP